MKKLRLAALVTLLACIGALWVSTVSAFDPPNDRLYPPLTYRSAVVDHIKATHEATYTVVDNYGWSGWHAIVTQALDTGSPYEHSLGNIYTAAVPSFTLREARAGESPTMQQIAVSASAQMTYCNDPSGWSVACAFLLNPLPVPTYYKASTMQLYPFVSQAAVIEHETNHHISRACDQYIGGCPPTNSQGFQCTGNPDTLMDCSLGSSQLSARWAQPFDVDTFLLATGFARITCGGSGSPYWDACLQRWVFTDGSAYEPATGDWWLNGSREWSACNGDKLRYNYALQAWAPPGSGFFLPSRGYWSFAGAC